MIGESLNDSLLIVPDGCTLFKEELELEELELVDRSYSAGDGVGLAVIV